MTDTEPVPAIVTTPTIAAAWEELFSFLRRRFPAVSDTTLFGIHLLQMDPDVSVADARAQAAMHGVHVTAASLSAAKQLLSSGTAPTRVAHGAQPRTPEPGATTTIGRETATSDHGAPPRSSSKTDQIRALLVTSMGASAIARTVGCSRTLVNRVRSTPPRPKADRPIAPPRARTPKKRGRPIDPESKSGRIRALLGTGLSTNEIAQQVGCDVRMVLSIRSLARKAAKRGALTEADRVTSGMGATSVPRAVDEFGSAPPPFVTGDPVDPAHLRAELREALRERDALRAVVRSIREVLAAALP